MALPEKEMPDIQPLSGNEQQEANMSLKQALPADSVDLSEFFTVFSRKRWLAFKIAALIFVLGMGYTFAQRPQFQATTRVLVTTSNPISNSDAVPLLSDLQGAIQRRSVETQVEIISSPDLQDEVFKTFTPQQRKKAFGSESLLPAWALAVTTKKGTDIIELTARAYTPEAAATLANKLVELYLQRDAEQTCDAIRQVRKDVEDNMHQLHQQLDGASSALAVYKQKTGLISPDTQLVKAADYLANLQVELGSTKREVASNQDANNTLRKRLAEEQQTIISNTVITQNPRYTSIVDQIDQLNAERNALLHEYLPQSSDVKAVDGKIEDARAQLKDIASTITGSYEQTRNPVRDELLKNYATNLVQQSANEAKTRAIDADIMASKSMISALPERERTLTDLIRQVALLQGSYDMLGQKYYALLASETTSVPNGRMISSALPDKQQSHPNPLQNAGLFLFLGVVFGGVVAVRVDRTGVDVFERKRQDMLQEIDGPITRARPSSVDDDVPATPRPGDEALQLLEADSARWGIGDPRWDPEWRIHQREAMEELRPITGTAEAHEENHEDNSEGVVKMASGERLQQDDRPGEIAAIPPPTAEAEQTLSSVPCTAARDDEPNEPAKNMLTMSREEPLQTDTLMQAPLPTSVIAPIADDADAKQAPPRMTTRKRREATMRLLAGEPLDMLSEELSIEMYRLALFYERAIRGIDAALKERDLDLMDSEAMMNADGERGDGTRYFADKTADLAARGKKWTVPQKREIVLRLLAGEPINIVSVETGVEMYRLALWRETALLGVEKTLKTRDRDLLNAEIEDAIRRISELSVENTLLRMEQRRVVQPPMRNVKRT
jgi:uncharacterized protein involved in exopolysaccharide biosynthesis